MLRDLLRAVAGAGECEEVELEIRRVVIAVATGGEDFELGDRRVAVTS